MTNPVPKHGAPSVEASSAQRQARIFDTTLSAITDFVYIFDLSGRFLYVNKALLDLWGLSLEQATGKNFFDLHYPELLAARLQQQIQQVIETRTSLRDETPYTSPTGVIGYYEYIFSPVVGPDGSVEVVAGSTRDVSARKNAENALRQRTAQFETLLDKAPLGVYLIDADFRIREANPTARRVFGDIPKLLGRDFVEVIHCLWSAGYADEIVHSFRHTLETGEQVAIPERVEQRLDRGETEIYEWQINRIPLPDGRFGVVCYFRDVSQQVHARRRLEAADRQKNEFLAMLAHELRNPLAPIRNASELLARTIGNEPSAQAAVSVVKRQVSYLTRLVDDLLDIARITQGKIELRRAPLELAGVIGQAVEIVGPVLREKEHQLTITTSYQPLRVSGDSARLVQCVANILSNAAKYTDPKGEIRIQSWQDGNDAVICVTDNGAGIPADLMPHLFELFVQSDRTLDRAQGGLGIGLAVVKRLVEMHGGRVTAASAGAGCGASFEIRLPIVQTPEQQPALETPSGKAPPRRVLVVDDNADSADTLAMLLTLDGHIATAVYSAAEAIARAESLNPQVVLLDIGLPEIDGYEVARRLRAVPSLEHTCLVALTGYGQLEDRQRALAAGFNEYLVKPVEFPQVTRLLSRIS